MERGLASSYRRLIIVLIVAVFFTNWATYATMFVTPDFPTLYWAAILGVLALPLMTRAGSLRCLATPLVIWALVFIVVTWLYFLIIPGGDFQILKNRTLEVLLILVFTIVFGRRTGFLLFARRLILIAVWLGIALNILDFLHVLVFVPPNSPIANPGRAAGLYLNANESGCALLLGMILTIGLIREQWRSRFALCVLVGVVLTFSRAAILGWFLVVFLLWAQGYVRAGRLLKIGIPLILALVVAWPAIATYFSSHPDLANAFFRIDWFLAPDKHQAGSSELQRIEVAQAGWQLFLQQPIFGNGIGSSTTWQLSQSTHDMYLLFMDDYGIAGLLLYLLLPLTLVMGARGEGRRIVVPVAVLLLFWGFFSHNELDNYYSLVAITLSGAVRTYLRTPLPPAAFDRRYSATDRSVVPET